jgi:hypothetical protein
MKVAAQTTFVDPKVPDELRSVLREIERWSIDNKRDAQRDLLAFWAFKTPAIFASASAGLWAHFGFDDIGLIAGVLAMVCVALDGIVHPGLLYNMHQRAHHELENLRAAMMNQWRTRDRTRNQEDVAITIIRSASEARARMAAYVVKGETSFDSKHDAK